MSSDLSLFNFNAEHNGVACIESLDPADRGTKSQFWFTIAMFCTIYDEVDSTIRRNIESLNEDGELGDLQKCKRRINVEDSAGVPHSVTIYNLEVLNKLGMCCFRGNKKAKEIRNKFNDVLVMHETIPSKALPQSYAEALRMLADEVDLHEKTKKALEAEKESHTKDNDDFCAAVDILERKKAQISSKREATCMAETAKYKAENDKLREQIGDAKSMKAVTAIPWLGEYFAPSRGLYNAVANKLKAICFERNLKRGEIPDTRYGSVKTYPIEAINILHTRVMSDPNMLAKYRKEY